MNYQPRKRTPVWVWIVAGVVFVLLCCGGITAVIQAVGNETAQDTTQQQQVNPDVAQPVDLPAIVETTTEAVPPPVEEPPAQTASQEQAVRKADQYLDYMAFSRQGLINQLEYEGFSTEDATYAADAVGADWFEQAAKKAQQYLDTMPFSRQGLIDQLIYEGFTPEQAEHGVTSVGL